MQAVHQSSDVVPQLKGATGAVLAVWGVLQRKNVSKVKAQQFRDDIAGIIDASAHASPEHGALADGKTSLNRYHRCLCSCFPEHGALAELQSRTVPRLNNIAGQSSMKRLRNLNRNEDILDATRSDIDRALTLNRLAFQKLVSDELS
ncbi:hypothetical protein D9758_018421 [Tetrapyrgos nigripes]|uniref:Uncharacterized protein n=1 Tax=Tetrapyrgos nigripes TaxID=182062 RepID=A0A8H5LSQ0_9AGAR|nr:hypothetical protein D9758_018421 [Tetrapyrgos nigripes]